MNSDDHAQLPPLVAASAQARHIEIKKIFLAACELTTAARAAYLSEACLDDESLRAEVLSLLDHHETDGNDNAISQQRFIAG